METDRRFYVYVLSRPNGKPFYVGMGVRSRDSFHEWAAKKGRVNHCCNVIRKIWSDGKQVLRKKVAANLTQENAATLECQLIAKYGKRSRGGLLVNISDGGDGSRGYRHDLVSIAKMKKAWITRAPVSDETKAKMSASLMGRKVSEETKRKVSESIKGVRHWNFGKKIKPENAEKLHAAVRKRVSVDGVIYQSMADAAMAFGIAPNSVTYRCGNNRPNSRFKGWKYV